MIKTNIFANHFLVAMPQLDDLTFAQSVIYLSEHNTKGALGIIINKPLQVNIGNVLEHLKIVSNRIDISDQPVLMGGPIGQEHGFIIYENHLAKESLEISVSASKFMLEDIAKNKGPNNFLITLGYSGWEAGQLEKEIVHNDWLIAPFDRSILFETPIKNRWQKAASLIGIDINRLSDQIGHA